jgi:transposase
MEQVLGILFAEGLVGLEHVTQDGTKIRAQASKRSFLDRRSSSQGRSNNNAMPDPWM